MSKTYDRSILQARAQRAEQERRLARYDEAIRLLREVFGDFKSCDLVDEIGGFLADEPKEGRG